MSKTTISVCPTPWPQAWVLFSQQASQCILNSASGAFTHLTPNNPSTTLAWWLYFTPYSHQLENLPFSKSNRKGVLSWERQIKSFLLLFGSLLLMPMATEKNLVSLRSLPPPALKTVNHRVPGCHLILPLPLQSHGKGEEALFYSKLVSKTPTASTQHPQNRISSFSLSLSPSSKNFFQQRE